MKPTRDDLRASIDSRDSLRRVTPEEFDEIAIAEGYVKLDVDVEALREALYTKLYVASSEDVRTVWNAAHAVLVAMTGIDVTAPSPLATQAEAT